MSWLSCGHGWASAGGGARAGSGSGAATGRGPGPGGPPEVIISRGQLIEIGGGFRIPDVLRRSGAALVEVGTTNRTYLRDYELAITERTRLLLSVHRSNFKLPGFVHDASLEELVELGRQRALWVMNDLGSGTLLSTAPFGLGREPTVQERVAAGADLVCFSGDKLLGGPQARCVGQPRFVERMPSSVEPVWMGPHMAAPRRPPSDAQYSSCTRARTPCNGTGVGPGSSRPGT